MIYVNLDSKEIFKDNRYKSITTITKLFREKTFLGHTRIYPSTKEFFIYNYEEGIYIKFDEEGFKAMVGKVFTHLDLEADYTLITKITNNFKVGPLTYPESIVYIDEVHICFDNGVLNLKTGEFSPHSPQWFIVSKLYFDYNPTEEMGTAFLGYLQNLTNNCEEKKLLLRSWLKILISRYRETQTFLYIQGQARTGKSVLGHIASALIGDQGTVITSLRSLNNDAFEVYNLKDKHLIIISDTEYYSGDLSVLKQAVGGDPLKGRIKFIQGSHDIYTRGLIMIIGNYGFGGQDTSGAIKRRMRLFKAENKVENFTPLIYRSENKYWAGPLAKELPGIFNWVYKSDMEEAIKVLDQPQKYIPLVYKDMEEEMESLNPMETWIQEELEIGKGAYIGYQSKDSTPKGLLETQQRGLLYPSYTTFCHKRGLLPLKHKLFSTELINVLSSLRISCRKQRRKEGVFIEGIQLKLEAFDRDRLFGGPIISRESLEPQKLTENLSIEKSSTPIMVKEPPNYNEVIYNQYISILGQKTKEKRLLNSYIKEHPPSIDLLLNIYFKDHKLLNENFREHVKSVFQKGLGIVTQYGSIPYVYKRMGVSPRIIPVNYGDTLNNTKKILRQEVFSIMNKEANNSFNMTIVDFDIKSCYTSILIGLYPKPLQVIQEAIEGKGLWNYIKEEFDKKNRSHLFNKPAVKICVYSSFFLGGTKAMTDGIMDNVRKDIGLTKEDWRKSEFYEDSYKMAQDVTQEMMNSSVIVDFQSIAQDIKNQYLGDYFRGPSGHNYLVTEENFRNVYPNFLQSYEITLLAVSSVGVVSKYPDVQIIGHYHDGNVFLIPNNKVEEVISYYQSQITELGYKLGLKYKQELEVCSKFHVDLK